ncbi:transmembrane protein, putative (macronuclear) [Tetrahymena thermophila SB210]|uniref:Transmembrane protein, putative n=1 Tax=Tetrahymena thermophila (strain SB210) TaxID=312017 RepID=W7XF94_TETTS|nr:transmembrane protein, putative [Tetrahymena thermophila SB210]EWS72666.1 transmembrane protein, putative [Tetrahymena thermophila SB210]|eukprot:XP_012654791.1 transmembrane protein, putative [Tetrahymena thermophila SB210]
MCQFFRMKLFVFILLFYSYILLIIINSNQSDQIQGKYSIQSTHYLLNQVCYLLNQRICCKNFLKKLLSQWQIHLKILCFKSAQQRRVKLSQTKMIFHLINLKLINHMILQFFLIKQQIIFDLSFLIGYGNQYHALFINRNFINNFRFQKKMNLILQNISCLNFQFDATHQSLIHLNYLLLLYSIDITKTKEPQKLTQSISQSLESDFFMKKQKFLSSHFSLKKFIDHLNINATDLDI